MQRNKTTLAAEDLNLYTILPVLLTSGRKRRNTGLAYGGSALSMSFTNFSRSVEWDGSAMAAIPAFPSAPVGTEKGMSEDSFCGGLMSDRFLYHECLHWSMNVVSDRSVKLSLTHSTKHYRWSGKSVTIVMLSISATSIKQNKLN